MPESCRETEIIIQREGMTQVPASRLNGVTIEVCGLNSKELSTVLMVAIGNSTQA